MMVRIPLYALLSLTLHLALIWLVQGQWMAHAHSQVRQPVPEAMLVMLAPLEAPPVAAPPAPAVVTRPAPSRPRTEPDRPAVRPVEQPKVVAKAVQPVVRSKAAELVRPSRPVAEPVSRPAGQVSERKVVSAASRAPQPVAVQEVFSREPSFLEPPRQPAYPSQARRRNQQGMVLVEVRLDSSGGQREIKVLRSSGVDSLDRAALDAVSGWRFRPETQNGKAVPSRVHIPIQFALTASR
ncbi:energy transducer TonB [Zestomonas carbonaria]|uniref:TonB C-terminal domain-containing protein n=1 Tax=Zestomonas carbonaria TaxID=2762745 RepID=A0A7U7EL10_9GAMM|nr:energy transducer TonB [Pseudomonas carbonaria]CAD5106943.1 hypothetical protein PSEWESI4_01211 [Pseudomonas carbonaria]